MHHSTPTSQTDGIITEEFTVPVSEESVNNQTVPHHSNCIPSTATSTTTALQSLSQLTVFSNLLPAMSTSLFGSSNISTTPLSTIPVADYVHDDKPINLCTTKAQTHGSTVERSCPSNSAPINETSNCYQLQPGDAPKVDNFTPISTNSPHHHQSNSLHDTFVLKTDLDGNRESIQLFFDEPAFVAAYSKTAKFGGTNRTTQNTELSSVLDKLRQFADYRIPILGRANQRRVAGCPVCPKSFNHGFTDLKKHLLVVHLGLRRDITRFALDFTRHSRQHFAMRHHSLPSVKVKQSQKLIHQIRSPFKLFRKSHTALTGPAITATSTGATFSSSVVQHSTPFKKHSKTSKGSTRAPVATVSSTGLPVLPDSLTPVAYTGSAPVHRVIPGTGVSDEWEDRRSLEDVIKEAPTNRGGLIPLEGPEEFITVPVSGSQTELYVPAIGRRKIQLSYSLKVLQSLIELYNVPSNEQIQLLNRMNHYSRMHVYMDVNVSGGVSKRYSCPTCMYTSVHSLADIRKHIMGSHCGISTKRFRICLRASRHDTGTYQLHADERMIRFVDDHKRKKGVSSKGKKTTTLSISGESDNEDEFQQLYGANNGLSDSFDLQTCFPSSHLRTTNELFNTAAAEANAIGPLNGDDENAMIAQCKHSSPATTDIDTGDSNANTTLDNLNQPKDEVRTRVDLPFSPTVLQALLDREGLADQYQQIMHKMQIYSDYYLTVVSRGNRIYSYICVCGRKFPVVRDDVDPDMRPASLADCRRHILGVHARIPQELLTLCCQASRISKENNYKLYGDQSLLALAEQYKFRSSRMLTYSRKNEDHLRPSSPPPPPNVCMNDSALVHTNGYCETNEVSTPPSISAEKSKQPHLTDSSQAMSFSSPERVVNKNNHQQENKLDQPGHKTTTTDQNPKKEDPDIATQNANLHCGLDLDPPRRILSPEESVYWGNLLALPSKWNLERIVRLPYNPVVFEEQLKKLLSIEGSFIANLHDRMQVYSRHSIYIVRSNTAQVASTPGAQKRLYVCCACLTTSQHGFGDVRKHILGVHAHVPERFKSAAMTASRVDREEYSLCTDKSSAQKGGNRRHNQLLDGQDRSISGRSDIGESDARTLRRRRRSMDQSPCLMSGGSVSSSSSQKRQRCNNSDLPSPDAHRPPPSDRSEAAICPSNPVVVISSAVQNGRLLSPVANSTAPGASSEPQRPPIILTLPLPKAFKLTDSPDRYVSSPVAGSEPTFTEDDQQLGSEFNNNSSSSNNGVSRSRRSMVLKSKRPCPSNI